MLNRSSLTPIYPASLSDCLIQTDPLPKFDDIGAIARQFYPDCVIATRGYDFRGDTCANPETYEAATRDPEKYAGTHGWLVGVLRHSDWVTRTQTSLLSGPQIDLLEKKVRTRLGITVGKIRGLDPKIWWPISRQIYADVAKNGKAERIDTFNGNYGLNRGLAAAPFALACIAASQMKWSIALGLLVLTAVYDYRAYRFGVHYARELYLQFLVLNDMDSKNASSDKSGHETAN